MEKSCHIAFDLGASSGRLVLGTFDGKEIVQEEIYRFANTPVNISGTLYWDTPKLFQEIKNGLTMLKVQNIEAESLAIDTWGVDFGYLDKNGELISLPTHYRDEKKLAYEADFYELVDKRELFDKTGVQPASINSIVQIFTDLNRKPYLKESVDTLLFTPDLFNYFLTGVKNTDFTIASTSSLLSKVDQGWDKSILKKLNIPEQWFSGHPSYGKLLGPISEQIQEELEIKSIDVISASSHDTAATLLAIPTPADTHGAFLSCGTWSVLGIENDGYITTTEAYEYGLTNEGSLTGKIRLLKNINGLWLLQQLQRYWAENGEMISYADLTEMAKEAKTDTFLDTNDEIFMGRNNMHEMIMLYCEKTNQVKPKNKGEMVRIILESLALSYAKTIKQLEKISNEEITHINMFGGGIKNQLLCQLTADFSGKKVIAGPTEASSIGNIMSQLLVLEKIEAEEVEEVLKNSFTVKNYYPTNDPQIKQTIKKFNHLIG